MKLRLLEKPSGGCMGVGGTDTYGWEVQVGMGVGGTGRYGWEVQIRMGGRYRYIWVGGTGRYGWEVRMGGRYR